MKLSKIILGLAAVAGAGVNVSNAVSDKQAELSDLQVENIEMLADAFELINTCYPADQFVCNKIPVDPRPGLWIYIGW